MGWQAGKTYTTLESADEQALEDLAGLVAVADVLEGFGRVLPADVEEHFFTAGVFVYEAWCCARSGQLVVGIVRFVFCAVICSCARVFLFSFGMLGYMVLSSFFSSGDLDRLVWWGERWARGAGGHEG